MLAPVADLASQRFARHYDPWLAAIPGGGR
jgi:hypothetical protein